MSASVPTSPAASAPATATGTTTLKRKKSTSDSTSSPASAAADSPAPVAAQSAPPAAANAGVRSLPLPLILGGCGSLGIGLLALVLLTTGRRKGRGGKGAGKAGKAGQGPCSKLKPTSRCVALSDGSACVIRREIAADNSCLFNSIGYAMHKSKTRAPHLRTVVAQQVSGDKATYSDVFLGMTNEAYCNWIRQPYTWGGGIELSILAQAYGVEIAAWNIESCKEHVFGEELGYKRQVMVIYNGVHYDALAVCANPRASPDDDETSYNPRTKRGKMIIAAARKLVELAHRESQFHNAAVKKATAAASASNSAATPPNPATVASAASSSTAKDNGTAAAVPNTAGGESAASTSPASAIASGSGPSASKTTTTGRRRVPRAPGTAAAADGAEGAATKPTTAAAGKFCCGDCGAVLADTAAVQAHALSTGHQNYSEVA